MSAPESDRGNLNVFISYARRDLAFADKLVAALEERGLGVRIDRRDLPLLEEWQNHLLEFIRAADTVVFLVSPHSIGSRWCAWEIEQVRALSKRLAPVVVSETTGLKLPDDISRLNYVDLTDASQFDTRVQQLVTALLTDVSWLREHTRIAALAERWAARAEPDELLMRGRDLSLAESWAASRPREAPIVTEAQRGFLAASRRGETARLEQERLQLAATRRFQKRATWALAATGLLVLGGLVTALIQARNANRRDTGVLVSLASRAIGEEQFDRAVRLSLRALPAIGATPLHEWSPVAEETMRRAARLSRMAFVLGRDSDSAHFGRYSADGRHIVAIGDSETIGIWDALSGNEVARMASPTARLRTAQFSPDGARIVVARADGAAEVWSVSEGRQELVLAAHRDTLNSAEFSPAGDQILTSSDDRTARLWDALSGREVAVLTGHSNTLRRAEFSPNGRLVVTASTDNTARIWDAAAGKEIRVLTGHDGVVHGATFSPDGTLVATASEDKSVRIWEAASGRQIRLLQGHERPARSVSFSPDGRTLVSGSDDGTVRLWSLETGQALNVFKTQDHVCCVQLSPDGRRFLFGARGVQVWDIVSAEQLAVLRPHDSEVWSAVFDPSGMRLLVATLAGSARIVDASNGRTIVAFAGHQGAVTQATYSPDGRFVATASMDATARIWDAESGTEVAVLRGHEARVRSARFNNDGTRIVTGSDDKTSRVWDASTGKELVRLVGHTDLVHDAEFSPDGTLIATASWDALIRLWDARTGAPVRTIKGHESSVDTAAFSADSKRLVSASYDRTARIWDVATGRETAVLRGHEIGVWTARFSRDDRTVLTASDDKTVRIWDAITGRELRLMLGHTGIVRSAAFSADGRRVVSASSDRTVRVWSIESDEIEASVDVRRWICRTKLRGAERLTPAELADPILADIGSPDVCDRRGPLSLEYWMRLLQ